MASTPPAVPAPEPGEGLALINPGRSVTFGEAMSWIPRSFRLFWRAPLMWILAILIFVVAAIVLQLAPIIGSIAVNILQPLYFAGFAAASRSLETGGDFEIEHLFAGFRTRSTSLIIVGAILMLGSLAILFVCLLMFMGFVGWAAITGFVGAIMSNNAQLAAEVIQGMWLPFLLVTLVSLLFFIPLLAAYWFAPYLVLMNGMKPVEAMKASLMACISNFLQMFVYSIAMLGLMIVVSIPVIIPILGWIFVAIAYLVLGMMSITGVYVSYRDIFTEEISRPDSATVTL
ncbi:MAG TPA: BPSS1780 family membrane protein [Usitatibacter sp.]